MYNRTGEARCIVLAEKVRCSSDITRPNLVNGETMAAGQAQDKIGQDSISECHARPTMRNGCATYVHRCNGELFPKTRKAKREDPSHRSFGIFSGIDNVFHDVRSTMILPQVIIIFLGRERSRIVRSREESITYRFEESSTNGLKLKFFKRTTVF